MAELKQLYDLVIIGAGPAGSAAAIRARQLDRSCLIIEPEAWPPARGTLEWLGPVGVSLAESCGLTARAVRANPFTGLQLYSWSLKQSVKVDEPRLAGWIVDVADIAPALLGLAEKAGARVLLEAQPRELHLGEAHVSIRLSGGRSVRGQILLIGDGLRSRTAELARLAEARESDGVSPCAETLFEDSAGRTGLNVVIGAKRTPQTAVIIRAGRVGRVRLISHDSGTPVDQQLREFLDAAYEACLLPRQAEPIITAGSTPAGVALELESLVGKRCLQIGETGGFVAAFSGECIYPGMRSGWMAAEAADRALRAAVLQDELQSFSSAWRAELADYLRLPNTDLALLMPLVFNNPQMSARVARAFLLGQTF